jgi:UrcA family protein
MNLALQTLAAVSLSVLAVAPAAAQQVSISYADLDVATPDGAAALAARVRAGADQVCGKPESRDMKVLAAWQACKDGAVEAATADLARKGAPVETATFAAL